MILPCRHISVSIDAKPSDVYDFASNPANLPQWATGLSKSEMKKVGEDWIAESPMGKVKVKFAPVNSFGILDHDVTLPDGNTVHNPLRVLKNGTGSEVIFTLYHQLGVGQQYYEADAKIVHKDLQTLKEIFNRP
jgi:Polyketide cyclase / dehydrase and lipid transport.